MLPRDFPPLDAKITIKPLSECERASASLERHLRIRAAGVWLTLLGWVGGVGASGALTVFGALRVAHALGAWGS